MKILLFLLITIFSMNLSAQLELKGLIIGNKYDKVPLIETSVGGIDGVLGGQTLNDSTLYCIVFLCGSELYENDLMKPGRIYMADVDKLLVGLETKYDIKYKKKSISTYTKDCLYTVSENGYKYSIMVEYNQYMSPTTKCGIFITDIYLQKIYAQEQQEKTNQDF